MSRNPAAMFWAAIAMVAVLFLGVTAVTAWQRVEAASGTSAVAESGETEAVVDVELNEFAIEPGELTAPAGVPITFAVANTGGIDHDFTLTDVGTTGTIAAGATGELVTGPLEPGEYEVICSVPGHEDAGMTATLTVTESAGATGDAEPGGGEAGQESSAAGHGEHAGMTPEQMVAGHDEGIAAFPAETDGQGNQPLEPTVLPDGTKEFELVADEIEWETEPGVTMSGMAYNGQIPGPRIDVDLGDRVRLVLDNQLDVPTSIHSHGLIVPNDMDGVPGLTQDAVMPGETFTYEFEIRNSGSHMYHSHFDSAAQVTAGLLGAFVVHDPADPPVDVDYTMVLNDGPLGYTINGKGFPATEPVVAELGQTVRVRYMNEGLQIHPMHLHGIPQEVVAKDGFPLPQPYTADTIMVAPGERIDVIVRATEPGTWAYHCHILNHAEAADGMFGMVTAMVVE